MLDIFTLNLQSPLTISMHLHKYAFFFVLNLLFASISYKHLNLLYASVGSLHYL